MVDNDPAYAVKEDLVFFRGDDIVQEYAFEDDDGPIDLTGYTINAKAYKKPRLLEFDVNLESLVDGKFSLILLRSVVDTMVGDYAYDVELIDTNDIKLTRIFGKLTIKKDVRA